MTSDQHMTKRQSMAISSGHYDNEVLVELELRSPPASKDGTTPVEHFPESIVIQVSHEASSPLDSLDLVKYLEATRRRCSTVAACYIKALYSGHKIIPVVLFSGKNVVVHFRRPTPSSKGDQQDQTSDIAVIKTLVQESMKVLQSGIPESINTSIAIARGKADIQLLIPKSDDHNVDGKHVIIAKQVFGPAYELTCHMLNVLPPHGLAVISKSEGSDLESLKDCTFLEDAHLTLTQDDGRLVRSRRDAEFLDTTGLGLGAATVLYWTPSRLRAKADDEEPLVSAFARLLNSRFASEFSLPYMRSEKIHNLLETLPGALDKWTSHWQKHRLWDINLAPELVGHGKEHSQSVERLLSSLVHASTTGDQEFSRWECGFLAVAAWLHDWGHIGGGLSRIAGLDQEDEEPHEIDMRVFVDQPAHVRQLHGLISQHLLKSKWLAMHKVPESISDPASILAGHHQGWTSFTEHRPKAFSDDELFRADLCGLLGLDRDFEAPSLRDDMERFWKTWSASGLIESHGLGTFDKLYRRFQFLLALLRVADGADLGVHRVKDHGEDRIPFLGRCLYREALRLRRRIGDGREEAFDSVLRFAGDVSNSVNPVGTFKDPARDPFIRRKDDGNSSIVALIEEKQPEAMLLKAYFDFLKRQLDYFDKHAHVHHVSFRPRIGQNSEGMIEIDVFVAPADIDEVDPDLRNGAVHHVAQDIGKELNNKDSGETSEIREVLKDHKYKVGRFFLTTNSAPDAFVTL